MKKLSCVLALLCGSAFAQTSFSQPTGNQFGCMFNSLAYQAYFSDYVCNGVPLTSAGGLHGNVGFNIGYGLVFGLDNAQNVPVILGNGPISGSVNTATHTIKANFAFTYQKVNHTGSFTATYKWITVHSPKGTWYKPLITNLKGSYK